MLCRSAPDAKSTVSPRRAAVPPQASSVERLFAGMPHDAAEAVASDLRKTSRSSHALSLLIELDQGADRPDFGGTIAIGIADGDTVVSRQARLIGGREWVRAGAVELGLDCLRRHLLGLPVDERIDFERR